MAYTGLKKSFLYELLRKGRIEGLRIDGVRRWSRDGLDRFLKNHTVGKESTPPVPAEPKPVTKRRRPFEQPACSGFRFLT